MFRNSSILLLILLSSIFGQVGSWRDIPVLTEIRAIQPAGAQTFLASDGGVYTFDDQVNTFEHGIQGYATENLDVNTLFIDSDSLLWIGSRSPGPVVEVFDLNDGSRLPVEFVSPDQVTSFAQVGDSVYATYTDGVEGGLLLYRKGEGRIEYLDQFSQFPEEASMNLDQVNDLIHLDGKLIFRTQKAVLFGTLVSTNLKDPENWSFLPIPDSRNSINSMIDRKGSLFLAIDNFIYSSDLSNMTIEYSSSAEITELGSGSADLDGVIFASGSTLQSLDLITGSSIPLEAITGIEYVRSSAESIWIASTGHFLSRAREGEYETFSANRPRDHLFNRMSINSEGDLMASARGGISLLTGSGWRTVIPSTFTGDFNSDLYDWTSMITDTLPYSGNVVVEDMVSDQSGRIFICLQGRGVLRVDEELSGESSFYTAADDILEPTFDSETFVLAAQMAVDSEDNLFVSTKLIRDGGSSITIITPTDSVYHVLHESEGLDSRSVRSIAIDDNDMIWTGSQIRAEMGALGGIHFLSRTGLFDDEAHEVSYLSSSVSPLASNEILQLEVDQTNTLWILTTAGVQSMQLPNRWLNDSELRNWANLYMTDTYWQLTDFNVTGIEIDPRGNRWFLSSNAGVHVYQQNGRWINDGFGFSTSNSDLTDNTVYAVAFDRKTGETYMSTAKGLSVLKTPFTDPKADYSDLHIYPQPFNPDIHDQVIIQGLMDNSSIKILTVSGALVRELSAEENEVFGYEAQWDGLDETGETVGSGVYLLYIFNEDGTSASQKLALVR